jgi:hypothetical protein
MSTTYGVMKKSSQCQARAIVKFSGDCEITQAQRFDVVFRTKVEYAVRRKSAGNEREIVKRLAVFLMLLALAAAVAAAASIDGNWIAYVPGPNGVAETATLTFRSDGGDIEGSMTTRGRRLQIRNGSLDDNVLRFEVVEVFNDNEITAKFRGRVTGQRIEFTRTVRFNGNERTTEFTAVKEN